MSENPELEVRLEEKPVTESQGNHVRLLIPPEVLTERKHFIAIYI